MEGVHIERQRVQFSVKICNGGIGIAVELRKPVHIIPCFAAVRVEDVGSVTMNLDTLHFLGVYIAANVVSFFDDQDRFPDRVHLMGKGRTEQARTHNQIIIVHCISLCFHNVLKLNSGISGEAAVDGQADAGDEACCIVIQQEQDCAHQIFLTITEAAHGGTVQNSLRPCGGRTVVVIQELCVLLGGEEAGGNGVDPNPHLREMNGQPLGEVGNSSLGVPISSIRFWNRSSTDFGSRNSGMPYCMMPPILSSHSKIVTG